MSTPTIINRAPYLRTSRSLPSDTPHLQLELSKMYVDIANAVNLRSIAIFDQGAVPTGEQWLNGDVGANPQDKKQTLRQVFSITSNNISFNHNISPIANVTRLYGSAQNGTNYFPLPYVDVSNVNNQIALIMSSTQIIVTAGAGSPPSVTSGYIVVEWIP